MQEENLYNTCEIIYFPLTDVDKKCTDRYIVKEIHRGNISLKKYIVEIHRRRNTSLKKYIDKEIHRGNTSLKKYIVYI